VSAAARALDERRLGALLRGEPLGGRIVVRDSIGSTNDILRDLAAEGAAEGTVAMAEQQTAGRGRLGRAWHSPRGLGLFVSVLFRPPGPVIELTRWTLGAAVAACDACRRLTGADVTIAWPNDLVWEGRKLGGVLAETRSSAGAASDLVVGAGLNVGHAIEDFPHELSSSATSLRLAAPGRAPEREELAAAYLRELGGIARALHDGAWSTVARRWEHLAPGATGRPVRVVSRGGESDEYQGTTSGLDEVGALRVRRTDGRIVSVRLVESIRPLEG
jgi:BirA family biotin operon repressor/biotin-[acetyl-CoA-carboxylase] ligase